MSKDNMNYIKNPTMEEKIHCLVSVVPADTIKLISESVIKKMRLVRETASELGIPQIVFMTKVDMTCPITKQDLNQVYQSKKIRENVTVCSQKLGVPINCIFPLKCYHDEIELDEVINRLMLAAVKQIVFAADDYVEKYSAKQKLNK